jgi:prepilin-type N-terminal cleavage/methylation domain-containing protein
MKRLQGFTLIELMIAVAILAIVSAIAIPAYNNYIRESRLGAMRMNLDSLRIAVEGTRLDSATGFYSAAVTTVTGTALNTTFGWRPEGDNDQYTYQVTAGTTSYSIQARFDGAAPWVLCRRNPTGTPIFRCCDGQSGSPSCP